MGYGVISQRPSCGSKKGLTVTADGQSKVHGTPNPPLTVSYTGFIGCVPPFTRPSVMIVSICH